MAATDSPGDGGLSCRGSRVMPWRLGGTSATRHAPTVSPLCGRVARPCRAGARPASRTACGMRCPVVQPRPRRKTSRLVSSRRRREPSAAQSRPLLSGRDFRLHSLLHIGSRPRTLPDELPPPESPRIGTVERRGFAQSDSERGGVTVTDRPDRGPLAASWSGGEWRRPWRRAAARRPGVGTEDRSWMRACGPRR